MPPVVDFLEPARLGRLAGPPILAAGRELASAHQVHLLVIGPFTIAARVDGPGHPATAFSVSGDSLRWSCSCPAGRAGDFCAHLAATAQATWEQTRSGD